MKQRILTSLLLERTVNCPVIMKMIKNIQSYVGIVNKMVWRKL